MVLYSKTYLPCEVRGKDCMVRMVPKDTQRASRSCRWELNMQNISKFLFLAHMGAMLASFPLMRSITTANW